MTAAVAEHLAKVSSAQIRVPIPVAPIEESEVHEALLRQRESSLLRSSFFKGE